MYILWFLIGFGFKTLYFRIAIGKGLSKSLLWWLVCGGKLKNVCWCGNRVQPMYHIVLDSIYFVILWDLPTGSIRMCNYTISLRQINYQFLIFEEQIMCGLWPSCQFILINCYCTITFITSPAWKYMVESYSSI